ncbi:MAG: glycosyltransferase [Sulfuricella sp.]|nr:glycosyltransferase [Sulfuricella sp.]
MFFSIFTPTHKPDYLIDTFNSLLRQSDHDWEWVVVPNGGCIIPAALRQHPQVRIVTPPDYLGKLGVGGLKRFACEQSRGEWLVELDHDDFLAPHALARIRQAAKESGAGFIYSDFSNFYPNGTCQVYDAAFGWENYTTRLDGREFTAMRAFPVDPSGLAAIFFTPNHVRAWRHDVYRQVDGHDPLLPVCDDYELVLRTYLAGVTFHHIPECLYFYRLQEDGGNTFLERNREIQERQQQIANQYLYRVIAEWCRRETLPMLDLGGAHNSPEGYTSVDVADADICCDIRYGLPLPDNSVGCIRAWDFLEHIPACGSVACQHGADGGPRCTVGVMNEIYRVLVPGGWLISRTPSTEGRGAFQDPSHASFWNPNSFWYYTRREQAGYLRGVTCRFQANRVWQAFPSPWHEQNHILYVFADLVALKGQRQAGICEI